MASGGVNVGPSGNAGHGLKGGTSGGPRGGNPVQYRASNTGAWGAAPAHTVAAAVAGAYPPQYNRYPTAQAATTGQMQVGQQLPPVANPYATATYAQHATVRNYYLL